MSEPSSRLPARASLEQLRKQAKEHAAEQSIALTEAQFALARRYGFDSWPKLVQHVRSLEPPTLASLEQRVADILAAFNRGDANAREAVSKHLHGIMSPQTVRARLKDHLGVELDSTERHRLRPEAAREFVARAHGFESWAELVAHMKPKKASRPADRRSAEAFDIDREKSTLSPRHALTRADWDALVEIMAEERITGLDARGQMTDEALQKVAQLDHVTSLALSGSARLTDDGLLHVTRLANLRRLDLGGRCRITDRGLEVLRHLPELREFNAWWLPRVSDAGMANLAHCEHLESADLMGTPTGDGTLAALAGKRALRRLKTGRLVTDEGLRPLHEIPAFKTWQGGEAAYELMNYDGRPNHLLLDGPFTDKGVRSLVGLDGLSGLSFFWHASGVTPEGLEPLAQLPRLAFLGCEGELCDDRAMRHIAAMPALRMLMAQGTVATDDGFAALARAETLEYLWGRECPNLGGRGFRALASLPALRGLGVSCKHVDDAALSVLPSFPSLVELMPMDVGDDGFAHVGRCAQLETLWCMYCRDTGDAATAHVAGLKHLKRYYAGNTRITDRSLEALSRMDSLERIELWTTVGVTDAGVAHLARLPRLRELSISGCPKVTRAGVAALPARVKATFAT